MSSKEQTSTVPFGLLNPPTLINTKHKMNLNEDDFLRLTVINTQESLFGTRKADTGRLIWKAVVMRVDGFEDGLVTLKARIPEKDATIPEPVEWVGPDIESCSHFLIDLHRTYIGKVSTAPKIGQIIEVQIPLDNNLSQDGSIMNVFDEYVEIGIKSTKIESGAQSSTQSPQTGPTIPSTPGDALGAGQKNPASQVATGLQGGS